MNAVEIEEVEAAELQHELVLEDLAAIEGGDRGVRAIGFREEERGARRDERSTCEQRHVTVAHFEVTAD